MVTSCTFRTIHGRLFQAKAKQHKSPEPKRRAFCLLLENVWKNDGSTYDAHVSACTAEPRPRTGPLEDISCRYRCTLSKFSGRFGQMEHWHPVRLYVSQHAVRTITSVPDPPDRPLFVLVPRFRIVVPSQPIPCPEPGIAEHPAPELPQLSCK